MDFLTDSALFLLSLSSSLGPQLPAFFNPASPGIKPGLQGRGTGQAMVSGQAGRREGEAGEGACFGFLFSINRRERINGLPVIGLSLPTELSLASQ